MKHWLAGLAIIAVLGSGVASAQSFDVQFVKFRTETIDRHQFHKAMAQATNLTGQTLTLYAGCTMFGSDGAPLGQTSFVFFNVQPGATAYYETGVHSYAGVKSVSCRETMAH
ncbi:hypothetical protein [Pelagibacterium limicola]|uniref:hypothetical protein n=1 Tax=Pelagibacterium limicola TaxID=2791022 RepID=UPI0018B00DE7|nr:hypothetical protein [Pelagibacterium limicola]